MYALGIEAFLAVARTQNISRASESLNLAQSTMSKRLKVLEQELGVMLIERGKGLKSIRLTPAGEAFIEIAERWDALVRETKILQTEGPKLTLSIGSLDSINYAVFPWLYRKLNQHQPKLSLQVITAHSGELYEMIERRKVDVAFTLQERVHPHVIVEKCYTEPMVGLRITAPEHREHELVHPKELDPDYELYVRWGPSYQIWHDYWWNPICPGRVHIDTAQLILSFLSDVNQWAIVPLSVAKIALAKGNFSIFGLSENPPDRVCYKIRHKNTKASIVEGIKILDGYLQLLLEKEFITPQPLILP